MLTTVGKSVMCSYILRNLRLTSGITACWYFCDSQDDSCNRVLRTIALQLLRSQIDLASLVFNKYVSQGCNTSTAQLRLLIPEMLEVIPCTRLVVDGLDECSHENQKQILKETQALRINSKLHFKILFSSREEVYIAAKLRGKPFISLSESKENVNKDIQAYVHHAFGKLQNKFQATHLSEVESVVVEKSKGIFYPVK